MTLVGTTAHEPAPPTASRYPGTVGALVTTARPRQWLKNVLVLAPAAAAGTLLDPAVAGRALAASGVFVLASAGVYLVNDARDVAADRLHPTKSLRPVASGRLAPGTALRAGLVAAALALVASAAQGPMVVGAVLAYLALTTAYSVFLKRIAVVDILVVALGFVLRTVGGGVAAGVPLSSWFILVALFGSLFLVAAKRLAEVTRSGATDGARAVLSAYPVSWLQQVVTLALTATVVTYATWALQYQAGDVAMPMLAASVAPFLAVLLRYSLLVAQGGGEEPERLLTRDPLLLVVAAIWGALVGAALYLA
ncbi:decaprenyl-phosphate phosphoribosyltransferase [Cellulomonas sp. P5_C6]